MHKFLDILKVIAPIALALNPATAPAAPLIVMAMTKAEEVFGPGTGPQKLDAARDLTTALVTTHNTYNTTHPIDLATTLDAFDGAVKTTVDVVKVIQGAKTAVPKQQNTDPLPTNPVQ